MIVQTELDQRVDVRLGRRRRHLGANRAQSPVRGFRGSADAAMIRVVLPLHLRTLAHVGGEVTVEVSGPATLDTQRAGSFLSNAARHHPRPHYAGTPRVPAVLPLRRRLVPRNAQQVLTGGNCRG